MKQKVIIVETGQCGDEIKAIYDLGYDIIFIYTGFIPINSNNLDYSFLNILDRKITQQGELFKIVDGLVEMYDIKAIMTTSDFFVYAVSLMCEKYNFFSLKSNTAHTFSSKYEFRKKQKELNYLTPEFYVFSSFEEGFELINNSEKWVFKPLNANESVGVRLIRNTQELKEAFNNLKKLSRFSNGLIQSNQYILEQYIHGEIYSCEFIKDYNELTILGITNRLISEPPFFIELGFEFPYEGKETESIIKETKRFIKDFNYDFGPCHIEFIMGDEGLYILETNPRLVGYPNYWMINKAYSIDILEIVSKLFIDGTLMEIPMKKKKYSINKEIVAPVEGFLSEIEYDQDWTVNNNVHILLNTPLKQYVRKATSNKDILLRIFVNAETRHQALKLLKDVNKSINLKIL